MHKLPNLWKSRHGVYYFRCHENGVDLKKSLRTKDWHTAKLLAMQIHISRDMSIKKYEIDLSRGLFKADGPEDHSRLMDALTLFQKAQEQRSNQPAMFPPSPRGGDVLKEQPTVVATPAKIKTELFLTVVEDYLAEKKYDNSEKTLLEKKSTYEEFSRLFGNVDTNSITADSAISYKNKLIADGLGAQRINKTISFMKDFFNYSINHKRYYGSNPFDGLTISKKSKLHQAKKSYQEFSDAELKLIFENQLYEQYLNKPDYYWLPILALYTGARIEELASLTVKQIQQEDDIWFFSIEKGKNQNSIRKIPLHQKIVESKFFEYVESVDENGLLFPHLKPSINGYSKNTSRRFGQYLELLKLKTDEKVFHSFRSTFINRMTYMNIHPAIIMGIVGHYEQSKIDFSGSHFQVYQQKKPVAVLKKSIDFLEYPLQIVF